MCRGLAGKHLDAWPHWDVVVQGPLELTVVDLKQAARRLGLASWGVKAQLVVRLLGAFGLTRPSALPAGLCMAMHRERSGAEAVSAEVVALLRDLAHAKHPIARIALRQPTAATLRRSLSMVARSMDELAEVHRAWLAGQRQMLCPYCGSWAARRCRWHLCGLCCWLVRACGAPSTAPCDRHVRFA